jgi:hypothetical protein
MRSADEQQLLALHPPDGFVETGLPITGKLTLFSAKYV